MADDPRGVRQLPRQPQRLPPRRMFTPGNMFDYDESRRPADMVYQYNRISVLGQEDTANQTMMEMNGWKPVPAERHPELAGRATASGEIVRGGLRLEELPKQYAEEARELENFTARNTVETQVQRLGMAARANVGHGVRRSLNQVGVNGEEIE